MIKAEENKKGYKKTSFGWIPKDWEILSLSDIGNTYPGLFGKNKDDFGTGLPYIPYLNIFNNTIIKDGEFDFVRIDVNENQSKVKKGDIFFTTSSETPNEVGMCSAFWGETKVLYLNSFCFGFRISAPNVVSPIYLAHYFRSQIGRKIIYRLAQGATRYNLSKTSLLNQSFYIPTYSEQISIANILDYWDLCIDRIKENIKLKEKRKKALMQQLLTGRKRLKGYNGKWNRRKMGDLFEQVKSKNNGNILDIYTISSRLGFVTQHEKFNRVIAGSSLDKYVQIKENEFSYNKGNSLSYPYGCIFKFENGLGLVPFVYISFKHKKELNTDFYKYYFEFGLLGRQLKKIITSGARGDGLLNVSSDDFFKLDIDEPPIKEQSAIANILLTTDKEIELLKHKLELLKKQKQGLMQVLLTGKVRVAT